jgi:hypothetical protein
MADGIIKPLPSDRKSSNISGVVCFNRLWLKIDHIMGCPRQEGTAVRLCPLDFEAPKSKTASKAKAALKELVKQFIMQFIMQFSTAELVILCSAFY